MNKRLQLFIIILFNLSLCSCDLDDQVYPHREVLSVGDNPDWSKKDYNDQDWVSTRSSTQKGVFWVRFNIFFEKQPPQLGHLGMEVLSIGSFEAYWDGQLIGKNGIVGNNKEEEVPGRYSSFFILPDSLTSIGNHVLALRVSNFYSKEQKSYHYFYVSEYFKLLRSPLITTSLIHLLAGAFLIVGIYYLFLYLNNLRDLPLLIFSITCFVFFALITAEYLKHYILYPYPYRVTRLEIIGWLTFALAFLVPLFFSLQFSIPNRKELIAGLVIVLIVIQAMNYGQYDLAAKKMTFLAWISSLSIGVYGLIKKQKESYIVLFGLILSGAINYFTIYDISVFLGFAIIILCMLYLLARHMQQLKQAYQSAQLVSARLRIELLKKNIQPHYLMNTLTSLIDWIEEAPKKGVVFIEALAEEFRVLSQIADHKLIPIEQEINLCKSHLRVMGFRKEIEFLWENDLISQSETVPPAIFLTIVENGISHSLPNEDGTIKFFLKYYATNSFKKYELQTIAKNRPNHISAEEGTGFKYIKARLKESYATNWTFQSNRTNLGWTTVITINNS